MGAACRAEVPGQHAHQGRGRQHRQLRRLRQARGRRRGPRPHLRDVLDAPRSTTRREVVAIGDIVEVVVLGHQQGQAGNLARHEADRGQPVDAGRGEVPARHDHQGHASATSPTTARSSRSRKASTACCTCQRHVLDQEDQPPVRAAQEGRQRRGVVLTVDQEKKRVALGLKQLERGPVAATTSPSSYTPGQIVKGKVTKITNFGVFVELEPDLEGLLHISRAVRPEGREARGRRQGRPGGRGQDPPRRPRGAQDRPLHAAAAPRRRREAARRPRAADAAEPPADSGRTAANRARGAQAPRCTGRD